MGAGEVKGWGRGGGEEESSLEETYSEWLDWTVLECLSPVVVIGGEPVPVGDSGSTGEVP